LVPHIPGGGHDFAEIWPTVIQIQALQAVGHAGISGTLTQSIMDSNT